MRSLILISKQTSSLAYITFAFGSIGLGAPLHSVHSKTYRQARTNYVLKFLRFKCHWVASFDYTEAIMLRNLCDSLI
jgi:hypothetical protein